MLPFLAVVSPQRQPQFNPFTNTSTTPSFNTQLMAPSHGQLGNLETLMTQLRMQAAGSVSYHLPTTSTNSIRKKTIVDPIVTPRLYELPTFSRVVTEKVTPPPLAIVPIEDPNPLQPAIDQGAPPVHKEAMPWLIGVRHRKMKKHKLKKFRKRMIFLFRKLNEIKKKKKEKIMLALERDFAQRGSDFDAEKYTARLITQAKRGGWGIDIFEDMRPKTR